MTSYNTRFLPKSQCHYKGETMKFATLAAALLLTVSMAFAHTEEKKKTGHDKEHSHVEAAKVDHDHDDAHHKDHDHKAHHPDHKDESASETKKKK